ncbi:MAG: ribonuclease P protein component [Clostridiales bacterium]|nr:ribonuclease P protein component [Clostridiales bacterium]
MLKKKFRLKKNNEFQAVYQCKNSVAIGAVVLYIRNTHRENRLRVGFSVSKGVGNAVVRNRGKRMMREAVRGYLAKMRKGREYVFVGRKSLAAADFHQVEQDVLRALERKNSLNSPTEERQRH